MIGWLKKHLVGLGARRAPEDRAQRALAPHEGRLHLLYPGPVIANPHASILSADPDGCNFYYGVDKPDMRQINVRYERRDEDLRFGAWTAYADGIEVGRYESKGEAEAEARAWLKEHPRECDGVSG